MTEGDNPPRDNRHVRNLQRRSRCSSAPDTNSSMSLCTRCRLPPDFCSSPSLGTRQTQAWPLWLRICLPCLETGWQGGFCCCPWRSQENEQAFLESPVSFNRTHSLPSQAGCSLPGKRSKRECQLFLIYLYSPSSPLFLCVCVTCTCSCSWACRGQRRTSCMLLY